MSHADDCSHDEGFGYCPPVEDWQRCLRCGIRSQDAEDLESMRERVAELEVMVKMPSSLIACVLAHVDERTECRVCVRAARVLKRQIDAAMRAAREATE